VEVISLRKAELVAAAWWRYLYGANPHRAHEQIPDHRRYDKQPAPIEALLGRALFDGLVVAGGLLDVGRCR